jgi:hypothetical protein
VIWKPLSGLESYRNQTSSTWNSVVPPITSMMRKLIGKKGGAGDYYSALGVTAGKCTS